MHGTTIFATCFAALAVAAPVAMKREDTYYAVSLSINIEPADKPGEFEPAPVEINVLTSLGNNTFASEIKFDGTSSGVDVNSVECRAYKDQAGVIPGSAPFTNASPAELSTNTVQIQSVLCYVTEQTN